MSKKLDHDQDKSDSIQKSANPDTDYMNSENLCRRCHGPMGTCSRTDCPQKKSA